MKIKTKLNMKRTFVSTVVATILLSSGIPTFAQTTEAADSLPTLPTLPKIDVGTPEFIDGEYVVTFKEGTTNEQMKQVINKYGGKMIDGEYNTNIIGLKLTDKQYNRMKQEQLVEIIEQNQEVELSAIGQLKQYSHDVTHTPSAWETGLTGKDIEIAVLDTGVSPHSDLNIAGGASTVNYTNSYQDDNGHGTHVAGIIGSKDNGIGTTGVASDATIYSVKVLSHTGKGDLMDIIEGMDWSIQKGVDIINVSLGTYSDSASMKSKVDEAVSKGIIVVAATGNTGKNNVMYPAKYGNVVAVGATDKNNNLASFSTYGPEVDVVAPGVNIPSTYLNNHFAHGNGTSQAAPYVAGMLALLSEQHPDESASKITQMLYNNTLDLGTIGKDNKYGYGLVQFPTLEEEEKEEPKEEEVKEEPKEEEEKEEPKEEEVKEEPKEEEEKEEPKEEEEKEEPKEDLPEGVTVETPSEVISWESFDNANRYRIAVEKKQEDGSYERHRYPQVVSNTEYDLSRARLAKNEVYKISIIPRVGFSYEEDKAIELFASFKGDTLVVTGTKDSIKEEPKEESPSSEDVETNEPTTEKTELPDGIKLDEDKEKIVWKEFADANRYRMKMETIDSNGNLQKYKFPRTLLRSEFDLSYLRDKDNYKLSIIPRIGFSYEEDQAKEFLVSTKGEEVIIASLSDSLDDIVKKTETNKQDPSKNTTDKYVENDSNELPYNIAYNNSNDTLSWDKIGNTNRYRLEMERKNSKGQYVSYSFKRPILNSEFKTSRILPKGHEYKVKIVPKFGWKYDYDKAFEVCISTKNNKVTLYTIN
ncbi:S8 family peptidase [Virgibacillus halodenitrificans]|uniref:S8 family peptidase n=1 Tax=Virgibacillus halodenitrificans TaxID=1482 RepID=UPI000EF465CA|nr:S8 family peptidase [Virgibacillus halodenitrificans]